METSNNNTGTWVIQCDVSSESSLFPLRGKGCDDRERHTTLRSIVEWSKVGSVRTIRKRQQARGTATPFDHYHVMP